MKTYQRLLFALYTMILEAVFWLAYPLLRLVLRVYNYTEALDAACVPRPQSILIHAASVGEVNAVQSLVKALLDMDYEIIINTVTVAGREQAIRHFPGITVRLSVLDIPHLRRKYLRGLNPRLILVVETEIWPVMLDTAANLHIPLVFINARISERTLHNFLRFKPLIETLTSSVQEVITQSEADAHRFSELLSCKVSYGGNLKYVVKLPEYDLMALRALYGLDSKNKVICFGSSRPGEETLILNSFKALSRDDRSLRLILAPRHLKRLPEVESLLKGCSWRKYTDAASIKDCDIILMDVMGHLSEAYALCDLAIVGGSFFNFGGHNPLEPAYYQKPIIMGEYYSSCRDSVSQLQARNSIRICQAANLGACIKEQLEAPDEDMGKRAKLVLTENAAALENHIRGIQAWL